MDLHKPAQKLHSHLEQQRLCGVYTEVEVALTDLQADEQFLRQLKEFKDRVQLSDEAAAEVFQEAARKKLERCLDTALEAIKKRTRVRDYSPAV